MVDTTTTNYGWTKPEVGGSPDTWGTKLNANLDSLDALLKIVSDVATATAAAVSGSVETRLLAAAPVGQEARFYLANAPAGWVKANGGTIGSAASGATTRANADTAALFQELWGATNNTDFPIQTSAGAGTTRGASAAADFAANKRFPLPDRRGEGDRGWDDGRGVDAARTLGSSQLDAMQGHYHSVGPTPTVGTGGGYSGSAGVSGVSTVQTGAAIDDGTHGTPRVATETRMRNVAALVCIKL